jgi:hypothetical protein
MRLSITFVAGFVLAICGIFLRLNAQSMAKPPQSATWAPGNWEATEWAFWQHAWSDLGSLAFLGGLLIVAVALHHWIKGTGREVRA